MKQKKKIKAFSTLILAGILCCSASILVYATNATPASRNNANSEGNTSSVFYPLPLQKSREELAEELANSPGTTVPPEQPEPEDPPEQSEPEDPPEPPIEPDDFESPDEPDEPDLPVYPMERVEFPPEEPEVPVEPVTPAEPEPQPEPAPQPEPEPQPQPEPEPAPQPEPAPTLPQTSQLWWPVGLVFILGFAMVLAGLVEMRKSRRHEDSDR